MGRSVETIGGNVIYFDTGEFYTDDPDMDNINWDDMQINLQYALSAKYKSLDTCKKWAEYPYRENRIILKNRYAQISISEYCGCGAISIFVDPKTELIELAEHWISQVYPGISKIVAEYCTTLNRIGTFSNGCGVFERKEQ